MKRAQGLSVPVVISIFLFLIHFPNNLHAQFGDRNQPTTSGPILTLPPSLTYDPNTLATGGDFNGDGFEDAILVNGWNPQATYLFHGPEFRFVQRFQNLDGITQIIGATFLKDVDGDQHDEIVLSVTVVTMNNVYAIAFSGRTLQPIWKVDFGYSGNAALGGGGDVNGDGFDDVILGANANAYVLDGRNGQIIWTVTEPEAGYGIKPMILDDLNGDGRDEFMVGTFSFSSTVGSQRIYDGATAGLIRIHLGLGPESAIAHTSATLDDMDGDGVEDYILTSREAQSPTLSKYHVWIFSGATGHMLHKHVETNTITNLLFTASRAGDFNGDGRPDYALAVKGQSRFEIRDLDDNVLHNFSVIGTKMGRFLKYSPDVGLGRPVFFLGGVQNYVGKVDLY